MGSQHCCIFLVVLASELPVRFRLPASGSGSDESVSLADGSPVRCRFARVDVRSDWEAGLALGRRDLSWDTVERVGVESGLGGVAGGVLCLGWVVPRSVWSSW